MQDIFNIPEEIRRNMFLQVNPEISKLLNNDSSLKNICTTGKRPLYICQMILFMIKIIFVLKRI